MRFFALGFVAGVLLCFVPYGPIAILGRIDVVAAFVGLILVTIYTHSYEPWAWRRLNVRARRWRNLVTGAVSVHDGQEHRPILSP